MSYGYHRPMAHYPEAFAVLPGQCFRFVHSGVGHASHCRDPVVCRGRFKDRAGKWHWVEACLEHGGELVDE
jgi:hypothetical protein